VRPVRLRVCGDGSPVSFLILCVPVPVGVGGALMALVRSRWGRGGAREEKLNLKGWIRVGRNTVPRLRGVS
jgi:hypothetical protein